ncbi:hypothetical protein FRC08_007228 [Ceratobasidium sp. 394]|nr:hypothetical protein FRC08_007228 [Ceratobasidium sp. 394]
MLENERMEDLSVMLMDYVSGAAGEQVYGPWASPDPFLGWSSRHKFKPLVSRPNSLILLNILWKDRKGFLKAWAETHALALLGPLFILWRGVEVASTRNRWANFGEVFWRYYIVAGTEHPALEKMKDSVGRKYQQYDL